MSSKDAASSNAPSRRALHAWWERFTKGQKKEDEPAGHIFGVPLHQSIEYANVAISLTDENGQSFIYGYVPVIVAKCGVFLKEKATDVEGIFRLSGSAKRIKDLQNIFNSPDKFGKGLDWEGYTVHDAANILRRYLNQLPEPIIPLEFYDRFRKPLITPGLSTEECIKIYQKLISELPPLNRQLLLYILDLLAVFASKSEQNLMTAENLSAIFQPGLINHPSHDMSPEEYATSQEVLVFLINHQDNFLLGMPGKDDGRAGKDAQLPVSPKVASRKRVQTFDSFSSTNSVGAEQVRKQGAVRRNASLSSRRTTNPPASLGIGRSNTLPSRRRHDVLSKPVDFKKPTGGHLTEASTPPVTEQGTPQAPKEKTPVKQQKAPAEKMPLPKPSISRQSSPLNTPNKERPFSTLFAAIDKFSSGDQAERGPRPPSNRLKKRRPDGESADSSTVSLAAQSPPAAVPPTSNPIDIVRQTRPGVAGSPPPTASSSGGLPTMSPTSSTGSSIASRASDLSDQDMRTRARKRWRLSRSVNKSDVVSPPFSPKNGSPERKGKKGSASRDRRERRLSESASDNEKRGVRGWIDRQMSKARQISTERKGDAPLPESERETVHDLHASPGSSSRELSSPPRRLGPDPLKPTLPTIESGSSENTVKAQKDRASEETARGVSMPSSHAQQGKA